MPSPGDRSSEPVRVLVLGAHPDDAEFHAGGLLLRHAAARQSVRIVSVTNGAAGHHQRSAQELTALRRAEGAAVTRLSGCEYAVWDFPDGELLPTLDVRRQIIAEIRTFAPDLVLTHRTCDYHPDHRAVGQAVQDASFMVKVPKIVPGTPALRRDPVVAYMNDLFTRPVPLRPDILLDVTSQIDAIVTLLDCHHSQVYEWLPYVEGLAEPVPEDQSERLVWLRRWYERRPAAVAERFRAELVHRAGDAGQRVAFAEAYEISEYATRLDQREIERLFPGAIV